MRSNLIRLAALAAGVVIVASCDTRLPSEQQFGSGSSSSSSSTTKKPTITIDSPTIGTLINLGDSVLVSVHLHDDRALRSAVISGVSQKGSVDLGTFLQTTRYKITPVPLSGSFRSGLRDTTVRRYLQPVSKSDSTLDSLVIVVIATDAPHRHRRRPESQHHLAHEQRQHSGRRRPERRLTCATRRRRGTHRHSRAG
jgi:hypothetical protein